MEQLEDSDGSENDSLTLDDVKVEILRIARQCNTELGKLMSDVPENDASVVFLALGVDDNANVRFGIEIKHKMTCVKAQHESCEVRTLSLDYFHLSNDVIAFIIGHLSNEMLALIASEWLGKAREECGGKMEMKGDWDLRDTLHENIAILADAIRDGDVPT
jgi:hypothetical protein